MELWFLLALFKAVLLSFVNVIGHLSLENDNMSQYSETHNTWWLIKT